jgi:hypothetical protein
VKQSFVLAAVAMAMAGMPVQAQPVAADLLPAYEVNTIVASMGMRPVGRPAWMRGRYVVAAIDRYGRDVNVVLDARDGEVLAVRPLGRGRFGPPSPGHVGRPAPYDRGDERMSPPAAIPGAPPPDEGEFFDNDRQQGALPAPRSAARSAPPPRDPSVTGSVARSAPVERKEAAPKDATPRDAMKLPRPRPALARANDPGSKPAAAPVTQPAAAAKPEEAKPAATPKSVQVEAKAEVKPAASKPDAGKPETRKLEGSAPEAKKSETKQSSAPAAKPGQAKPEVASKPDAPKPEVRVIDLSKPKTAPKPDDKPGEAIQF